MATEVVSTIRSSGGDYTSWQAAEDAISTLYSSNLVTADVQYTIAGYAEGAGSSGEWTTTSAIVVSGTTVDATRYVHITAASGQSFRDHADKLTNPLRYTPANGVSIYLTGSAVNHIIDSTSQAYTRVSGLQFRRGATGYVIGAIRLGATSRFGESIVRFDNGNGGTAVTMYSGTVANSVIYCTDADGRGVSLTNDSSGIKNCTIHGVGAAHGIAASYSAAHRVDNTAVFGFTATVSNTAFFSGSSSNNATNLASFGFGSSNQVSLTASDQFESVTSTTEDFRAKATGVLDTNAVRDATNTADLDIIGQSRSTTTPTIGAWENVSVTFTYLRPASDVSNTGWTQSTGSTLWETLDETTSSRTDYISASAASAVAVLGHTPLINQPTAGTSIEIGYDAAGISGTESITIELLEGSTARYTSASIPLSTAAVGTLTMTAAQWANVSAWPWTVRVRITSV
jgi:hypothetical protein